jgi:hypothetical protein
VLQGLIFNKLSCRLPAATYPAPLYVVQIVGDDGEELTAVDVVKQPGGISGGVDGPRATFSANVQFSITDPAYGAVSGSNECGCSFVSSSGSLHRAACGNVPALLKHRSPSRHCGLPSC